MLDGVDDRESLTVRDLPDATALPEIRLISHSSLLYWWPVWVTSLALGVYSLAAGRSVSIDSGGTEHIVADSTFGLVFATVLLAIIGFTNVKLRGLASLTVVLALALLGMSIAYFGLWDQIFELIPSMSVHMNAGFYLFFGGALATMWFLQILFFDRLVYYRIRPGQMIEERMIGGGERSFDTEGMLFEQEDDDFFRHRLLGLGAGDLKLVTNDARGATIVIPNVLRAERRVAEIQRLINVKPDQLRG